MIINMNKSLIKHVLSTARSSELGKTFLGNDGEGRQEALVQLMNKKKRTHTESLLAAAVFSDFGRVTEANQEFERCLENKPKDAATHLLYAMHTLQFKDLKEVAVSHFEDALKLGRKNAAYPYFYGYCLSKARQGGTAKEDALKTKELYEHAIELNQQCASAHNELGLLLWHVLWQMDEAEEHFKRAVEIAPKDARWHRTYAIYLMEHKEDRKEAKKHFKRAIELDPSDAQNHCDYGRLLAELFGDDDGALAEMTKAIEIDPDFEPAYQQIAEIELLNFHDVEKAREAMRIGLQLVNREDVDEETLNQLADSRLFELIGIVLEQQDSDLADERALYEMGHELMPQDTWNSAELGVVLWLLDENEKAKTVLEEAVRMKPDDAWLNYLCGLVLDTGFNDIDGGKRYYSRAMVLKPKNGTYHRAMARLLIRSGADPLEVEGHLKEALKLDPDELGSHRDYGIFLMDQLKDYDRARKELEKAVSLDDYDEDVRAHIYLARAIMLTTKNEERALEHFEITLEGDPHFHEGRREFAIFLLEYRYGGPKKAKALYQDYLRQYPDSARARMDYAILLKERFNDLRRAGEHMEKASKLDVQNVDLLKMRMELNKEVESARKADMKKEKKTK